MFGIPTFDLLTDSGKQSFVEYVVNLMRNEIVSYTSSYINSATNITVDLTPYATIAMLTAHEADTTNVHGIVDTSDLLTTADLNGVVYQNTPYLDFDTVTPGASGIGQLAWNDTNGTLEFILKGGNVPLDIGQENVALVKHADNTGLTKGKVVYVAGSDGTNKTVRYAQANSEATSSKTFGVMAEDATGGSKGFVCTQGIVSNINTLALTEGAAVYVSPTTAGDLTSTKPSAPNHMVLVGFCVRSHASNGVLYISVVNGFELQELHNVSINVGTLANGDIIKYNSSTQLWENVAADDIPAHASTHGSAGSDPITIAPSQVTGTAVVASDLSTHTSATTSVHGISNTANLVYTSDSRLTNARVPTGAAGGVLSGTYPNPTFAIKPVPSGALMPFAGSTAPTGWLLCFGQTLNATTNPEYADLYAVIGTTYGGSSISSFNLPDLRGRISVGLDSNSFSAFADRVTTAGSNLNSRTLGATGGNQSMQQHSHSVTDPGHGHGVYDPGHVHNYWYITSLAGYGLPYPYYGNAIYSTAYGSPMSYSGTGISIAGNSTGISIQNTGGGTTSSQNVQPSIILNYIIKY